MNKREPPTKEAFDKLLAWLHPDRDRAAEKYQLIHHRLVRIFASKGYVDAEELADQTVNVVASKIDELAATYVGNPAIYFYAVAKKIQLEQWKKRTPEPLPTPDNTELEHRCACLDKCLESEASPEEGEMLLNYHEGEGRERIERRKRMAKELGISVNALRIRVCHLQARLRPCIEECLRHLEH